MSIGIGGQPKSWRIDDRPCPCVRACGLGTGFANQWWIEESDTDPLLPEMTVEQVRAIANEVSREANAAERAG